MMASLVKKELRQLWPIGLLWLSLGLLGWVSQQLSGRPDEQSLANWCDTACDPGISFAVVMTYVVFGLITAYSLYPREYDDGTIDFLRALPISQRDIFISKVVAAVLLLSAVSTVLAAIVHLSLTANPESLRGGHYPGISLTMLARDVVLYFVIVAYGIFLSTFRILGLIIFAGYFYLLYWLETKWQISGPWNLFEMFQVEYHGQQLLLPVKEFATQALIAVVLLLISYRIFSRAESANAPTTNRFLQSRGFVAIASIVGFGLTTMIVLGLMLQQTSVNPDAETARTRSEHYHFVYHPELQARATALRDRADQIYQALIKELDATDQPTIRANLTARSRHFAGQAAWKTLRMDLSGVHNAAYYRHVLGHETVHVLQATESNRKLRKYFNSARFFIEGSAEYLTFKILPNEKRRRNNWTTAATAAYRLKIDFEDLTDSKYFSRKFDADQFYALGDIWSSALEAACGQGSIGRALRAFARPDMAPHLSGIRLWQDVLQSFGCELTDVNAHWKRTIRQLGAESDERRFPEFGDIQVTRNATDALVVRARLSTAQDRKWPGKFNLKLRHPVGISGEPDRIFSGRLIAASRPGASDVVEFTVPDWAIRGSRFQYQLGYNPPDTHANIYGRWRSAATVSR